VKISIKLGMTPVAVAVIAHIPSFAEGTAP
jgi:hypothetical protein